MGHFNQAARNRCLFKLTLSIQPIAFSRFRRLTFLQPELMSSGRDFLVRRRARWLRSGRLVGTGVVRPIHSGGSLGFSVVVNRTFHAVRPQWDLEDFRDELFFRGILAPDRRASLRPIATACLRLFTFLPLPDFNAPCLYSCITFLTLLLPLLVVFLAMAGPL